MNTPSNTLSQSDRFELSQLAIRYAAAVDDRDFDAVGTLFAADGELIVETGAARQGRDAIVAAMRGIERYDATFHHLGQIQHWLAEDSSVRGEVYCIAHHFTATDGGTADRVMYIRYSDTFIREDGRWCFARRALRSTWSGQEDKPE
ncbi:MAG: nuclear transport factor 2 family protein [Acidimicrobiales bacterium]|nr:nuclear transport factor 2 family protein [Acidimicrobiales bacterium]